MKPATQNDLLFLLAHGWKLVGLDTVESPDGQIQTHDVARAAFAWRAKLKAIELIKALDKK